jgi:predicted transcriptional regulator
MGERGSKRSSDEIVFKIIELMLYNDLNKTNLMYKANLSHNQQGEYFGSMMLSGLITYDDEKYVVTPKGLEFYIQKRIEKAILEFRVRLNETEDE